MRVKIWSDPYSDIGSNTKQEMYYRLCNKKVGLYPYLSHRFLRGFVYSTRGPRRGNRWCASCPNRGIAG